MLIIPVMDLLDGRVVHARGGRRDEYVPIRTPLCASSEPGAVLDALLLLHPFSIVYVADLDALGGRGNHQHELRQLHAAHPSLTFWVDAGRPQAPPAGKWVRTVLGSESGVTPNELAALRRTQPDIVLSLDFSAAGFCGDPGVLAQAGCWPRDVIVMHLPAVGAARGPDWRFIDPLLARTRDLNWYLAGGVRDDADVTAATARGMHGVLVATALHAGTLVPASFLQTKKTPA